MAHTRGRPDTPLRRDADAPVRVVRAGSVPYRHALDLQREAVRRRQSGQGTDLLLLLEHPRVYTLGRRTDRAHLLFDADERRARGIDLVEVDRGGDVTYHGPGQLVGYPIVVLASLRGIVAYVRALEEVLIRALASFGVTGRRIPELTGVWVGEDKIAAIGVRVASGGVTSHGFALNIAPDLADFAGIVPCGIADRGVCSLASLGVDASTGAVTDAVEQAVAEVFAATLVSSSLAALGLGDEPPA